MTNPSDFLASRRTFLKQAGAAAVISVPICDRLAMAQTADGTGPESKKKTGSQQDRSPQADGTTVVTSSRTLEIRYRYLNIPITREAKPQLFQISIHGSVQRTFPLQLAQGAIDYWVFLDVEYLIGETISISGPATPAALDRLYQADKIHGASSLYKESNRPQFHFTLKRGWNNDVNGPIFYRGQYHLFWQSYPYGVHADSGFMSWGHAVSKDMVHWQELSPALRPDMIGAAWSGTSFIDRNNVAGWGKDALVLVYTAFNRISKKQVQCLAYSTDNGATFKHYAGNPILDTNAEAGTTQTRDPKVFWHGPSNRWVMVLFEKDGMSFFSSSDLKQWTRQGHFAGLHECLIFLNCRSMETRIIRNGSYTAAPHSTSLVSLTDILLLLKRRACAMRKARTRMDVMFSTLRSLSPKCPTADEFRWHGEESRRKACHSIS